MDFFHSNYKIPVISNTDAIIEAFTSLVSSLQAALSNNYNTIHTISENNKKHVQLLLKLLSELSLHKSNHNNILDKQAALLPRVKPNNSPSLLILSRIPNLPIPSCHSYPYLILDDDDNKTYVHDPIPISPVHNLIPPDIERPATPTHLYQTCSRQSQYINLMFRSPSLKIFKNHFINLVTNPFTGEEENFNNLIKGNGKDEWVSLYVRELGRCTNSVNNDGSE